MQIIRREFSGMLFILFSSNQYIQLLQDKMLQVSQHESFYSNDYELRNICGRFSLNTDNIDILALSSKISNASYNRKRLPAIVIRKTKPKGTILLFRNGKGMIIGLERMEHFELVCKRMAKQVSCLLGLKGLRVVQMNITNILATASLGYSLDLGYFCQNKKAVKNDNSPGVLYQLGKPFKSIMVYKSGKVTMWGAKNIQDIEEVFQKIKNEWRIYEAPKKRQEDNSCESTIQL